MEVSRKEQWQLLKGSPYVRWGGISLLLSIIFFIILLCSSHNRDALRLRCFPSSIMTATVDVVYPIAYKDGWGYGYSYYFFDAENQPIQGVYEATAMPIWEEGSLLAVKYLSGDPSINMVINAQDNRVNLSWGQWALLCAILGWSIIGLGYWKVQRLRVLLSLEHYTYANLFDAFESEPLFKSMLRHFEVHFEYQINGEFYCRKYEMKSLHAPKEGERQLVFYHPDNPQFAVLLAELPESLRENF
ncbi:hypothetical protein [Algivirga pacifica]|uniref:DUF3592 domain-containing protein n=1 Tax=Algivirga pacifica TaxID=1162670 RepID=A0ABP9DAX2_9BACT